MNYFHSYIFTVEIDTLFQWKFDYFSHGPDSRCSLTIENNPTLILLNRSLVLEHKLNQREVGTKSCTVCSRRQPISINNLHAQVFPIPPAPVFDNTRRTRFGAHGARRLPGHSSGTGGAKNGKKFSELRACVYPFSHCGLHPKVYPFRHCGSRNFQAAPIRGGVHDANWKDASLESGTVVGNYRENPCFGRNPCDHSGHRWKIKGSNKDEQSTTAHAERSREQDTRWKHRLCRFRRPPTMKNWRSKNITPGREEDEGGHVGKSRYHFSGCRNCQKRRLKPCECRIEEWRSKPKISRGSLQYWRAMLTVKGLTSAGYLRWKDEQEGMLRNVKKQPRWLTAMEWCDGSQRVKVVQKNQKENCMCLTSG